MSLIILIIETSTGIFTISSGRESEIRSVGEAFVYPVLYLNENIVRSSVSK